MTDMLETIIPKSDQMNFDDFTGGQSKTIKITKVSGCAGEQPIAINYEGDNGKPYKPGKSMRRVLVHCWGADGHGYVGRSMTLYGDPKVRFGGVEVGGIRISHLSHITAPITMALTNAKASRKPFTVQPLVVEPEAIDHALEALKQAGRDAAALGSVALDEWVIKLSPSLKKKIADSIGADLRQVANEVDKKGE